MVAVAAMLVSATITSAAAPADMTRDGRHVAVYATSYISAGATATINGDAVAGLYLTTGASSTVTGGVSAGGATTLGALATAASVCSAGATTLGALAEGGDIYSGGATTIGAGASATGVESVGAFTGPADQAPDGTSISSACIPPPELAADAFTYQLGQNQTEAADTPATTGTIGGAANAPLPGSVSAAVEYGPGVHKANGMLTIASGVTITLNGDLTPNDSTDTNNDGAQFIFNIDSYLAIGADVNVVVKNATNARVIWNVGGYAAVGAGANISGTIMTNAYITMGVESAVTGSRTAVIDANGATTGYTCDKGGAVYSLTSYVGIGAGATVGSTGITAANPNGSC
jgi:hypothetical protein